ncbi:MAG: M23 family metallopeptidase [Desulfobacterales bacterium]|nr:M23 family metallopeptidase [Desulfobacterales bacterium]
MKISPWQRTAANIIFWPLLVLVLLATGVVPGSGPDGENTATASILAPGPADPGPAALPLTHALAPTAPALPEVKYISRQGALRPGEGLDQSLQRLRIPAATRNELIRVLANALDMRRLQPGDRYSLLLDEAGRLRSAHYEVNPLEIYALARTGDNLAATRMAIPLEQRTVRISGRIDSSVFAAFTELGEGPKLIHAFADIFASRIDFNTEPRPGDRFEVVVDKYYKDGDFVGYGKILVARYQLQNTVYQGFYYTSDSVSGYFDSRGQELGTWFLRSPIPFGRVTSGFTHRRKHPILGVTRPHLGVDLAAPRGTPVMAVSDGRIQFRGRNGGFGNQVIIGHANGYRTHYGHLSRFKKGLSVGSRVKQKDIIGYVGSTGLSTGPHLDYRIQQNGVFRNPFALKFKPRSILKETELARFIRVRDQLVRLMDSPGSDRVVQARRVLLDQHNPISML